jgi:inositol phosphorylceramide mannosyltransferase catalytic subunit
MSIPAIIHQTWKEGRIPPLYELYVDSWRKLHPGWNYCLWTDADNRRFIEEQFPGFLECYDGYRWPIQRADAVRYFLLYHCGGVYVDLDIECLRPIDNLLSSASCVIAAESMVHAWIHDRDQILSNALVASTPGHPFLKAVIDRLPEFARRIHPNQPVLATTGPYMLTEVYEDYSAKETVNVLPAACCCPLTMQQADELRRTGLKPPGLEQAYAIHYHVGSWWRTDPVRQ